MSTRFSNALGWVDSDKCKDAEKTRLSLQATLSSESDDDKGTWWGEINALLVGLGQLIATKDGCAALVEVCGSGKTENDVDSCRSILERLADGLDSKVLERALEN